jgi:hypothetical protein
MQQHPKLASQGWGRHATTEGVAPSRKNELDNGRAIEEQIKKR